MVQTNRFPRRKGVGAPSGANRIQPGLSRPGPPNVKTARAAEREEGRVARATPERAHRFRRRSRDAASFCSTLTRPCKAGLNSSAADAADWCAALLLTTF